MGKEKKKTNHTIYPRIRELREKHHYTQGEVSSFMNYSQQAYSDFECGIAEMSTYTLIRLAKLYGTSVDYLLGLTDVAQPYPEKEKKKWYLE